jgi:hypothetical protein
MLRNVGFAPVVLAASIGEVALPILVAAVLAMVTTSLSLRCSACANRRTKLASYLLKRRLD